MTSPEIENQPKPSLLDQVIIYSHEGRMIDALVPIELIDQSDVPIDEEHSRNLAISMKNQMGEDNPTGQEEHIAIVEIPGEEKFHISDGFHRTAGKTADGDEYILCRIKTNATWEELIDSRILNATTHQPTKIPRLAEWIEDAWKRTPWGADGEISVSSAFALAQRDSSGVKLGLTEEDAEAIKEVVRSKATKWNLTVGTILSHLNTAQKVDPTLLKSSRKRAGSKKMESIPPKHLDEIGKVLPGDFAMQKVVAAYSVVNNLNTRQTRAVANEVAKFEDPEEANKKINDPEWKGALLEKTITPKKSRAKGSSSEKLEHRYVLSELDVCRLAIENIVLSGKYVALPLTKRKPMPLLYSGEKVPTPVKPFDWAGQNRKDIQEWINSVRDQATNIAEQDSGALNQQTVRDIVEATNNRILEDIRDGALLYTGVDSKQLLARLYMACLNEQIQHRSRKANSTNKTVKTSEKPEEPKQVTLDRTSFRNAIVGTEDTRQRRVLALTAMFKLPAFATAQILDIPKGDVKKLQEKSLVQLS